jgi:hypothetical protein
MKTIIFKPTVHINTDDLISLIESDILGQEDVDDDHNEIYEGNTIYVNDPIKIDDLIMILNGLKDEGSNYVAIDFHSDHREYEIDGQEIRLATQEEIDAEELRVKESDMKIINDRLVQNERDRVGLEKALDKLSGVTTTFGLSSKR